MTILRSIVLSCATLALSAAAPACGGEATTTGDAPCGDGRCDLPDDPDEKACALRRADAFDTERPAYLERFVRWSCKDVEGVTEEDRGQEYCEAFAIVEPLAGGGGGAPALLGRNLGPDSSYGTTPASIELTEADIEALEADDSAVVGQCVFSSWNSDIDMPVAGCEGGTDAASCPDVMGVPVTADDFRMTFDFNSNEAAQLLVEDCLTGEAAESDTDAFTRGCMLNADINDSAFSKADSTTCPAVMRLGECGCFPDSYDRGVDFPKLLSPADRRGFPLGSWSGFVLGSEDRSELPSGCRYVNLGDDSQTLVTCDLTASDVLNYAFDVRGRCAEKYADRLVVHVPIPADRIECFPGDAPGPHEHSCTGAPWVVER